MKHEYLRLVACHVPIITLNRALSPPRSTSSFSATLPMARV
jgi:hypothetical protein